MNFPLHAPLEEFGRLGRELGITLGVQRDDLLPFPLASSKVRALYAELASLEHRPDLVVTNGSIDSNHCRTLAFMAAAEGISVHLVLHGDKNSGNAIAALSMYRDLGASFTVVSPSAIARTISDLAKDSERNGTRIHIISGGCHSPAAANAYRDASALVMKRWHPDLIVVASGTGAIQGGLSAAAHSLPNGPRVVGISVARPAERGIAPVKEAASWAGQPNAKIEFDDKHIDGGYGEWTGTTQAAVKLGWGHGLPLDPVYTGKAFAGLLSLAREDRVRGLRVLFWHTGGLWNYIQAAGVGDA